MKLLTTFPTTGEYERARAQLDSLSLACEVISPTPRYGLVGTPCLVMEPQTRMLAVGRRGNDLITSGWVDYRPASSAVPDEAPPVFEEDVFGRAAIMALGPCVADPTKIRCVAHISGDLTQVFPYMNAAMRQASYNLNGPTFTFMDGYRMVSAYPHRIAVAKADEIVDAWRVLETLRQSANRTWARRAEIEPSFEMRERPPALEIFMRLPRTNCRICGEATCLAFAVKLWQSRADLAQCRPVFGAEYGHLKGALQEVCMGLGVGA